MKLSRSLLIITALATAACAQITGPESAEAVVALSFEPSLLQMPETKAAIFGTPSGSDYLMPNNSSYGLFICRHYDGSYTDGSNPYLEYDYNYNNVKASRSNTGVWYYTYFGYSNLKDFYLKGVDEDRNNVTDYNADIFAYAPYQESVTRLESIPFSITSATDVMYAEENADESINKDIDPGNPAYYVTNPAKVDVPLTFHHALALLEFKIRLMNPSTNHSIAIDPVTGEEINIPVSGSKNYSIEYIKIDRIEDDGHPDPHPLRISGTMNAMTEGTLSDFTTASSVTVTSLNRHNGPGMSIGGSPVSAYVLQVPSQGSETYKDGDYVISFKFSGHPFAITFTLLEDYLKPSDYADGDPIVFKPGFKYTFNFVIDNYIHFEGVNVGEWETVEIPLLQKEI